NDLSANLLNDGGWQHIALPIIAPRDQTYETAYGPWKRKKGELLRPDSDDVAEIEALRHKEVNPSFELFYQQGVEDESLPTLTAKHFPSFEDDISNLPHFISIDPGTDDGDRRSFSVIQVWASNGFTHYLVKQVRERCDFSKLKRHTKEI